MFKRFQTGYRDANEVHEVVARESHGQRKGPEQDHKFENVDFGEVGNQEENDGPGDKKPLSVTPTNAHDETRFRAQAKPATPAVTANVSE